MLCSLDGVIKRYMKEEIVEGHTLVNAVYRVCGLCSPHFSLYLLSVHSGIHNVQVDMHDKA